MAVQQHRADTNGDNNKLSAEVFRRHYEERLPPVERLDRFFIDACRSLRDLCRAAALIIPDSPSFQGGNNPDLSSCERLKFELNILEPLMQITQSLDPASCEPSEVPRNRELCEDIKSVILIRGLLIDVIIGRMRGALPAAIDDIVDQAILVCNVFAPDSDLASELANLKKCSC